MLINRGHAHKMPDDYKNEGVDGPSRRTKSDPSVCGSAGEDNDSVDIDWGSARNSGSDYSGCGDCGGDTGGAFLG